MMSLKACMIAICCVLLANACGFPIATADELIQGYSNLQKLTKSDFKGVPDNSPWGASTVSAPVVKSIKVAHTLVDAIKVPVNKPTFWRFTVQQMNWEDVEYETAFNKTLSWWRDKNADGGLLQHERGHVDITEAYVRELNAPATKKNILAQLNKDPVKFVFVPFTDQTEAEAKVQAETRFDAMMRAKADARSTLAPTQTSAWEKREADYDTETNHTTPSAQTKKKIAEWMDPKPAGPQALSTSPGSLRFDSFDQSLSFSEDIIEDILGGSAADSLVGSAVILPEFSFIGETSWHDLFFSALNNSTFSIGKGSDVYLTGDLPYLIYSGNTFHGIPSSFDWYSSGSDFLAALHDSLDAANPLFMGIRITPDDDLRAVTQNFTVDGSTGIHNLIGGANVTPEPSTILLITTALLALSVSLRRCNAVRRHGAVKRPKSAPWEFGGGCRRTSPATATGSRAAVPARTARAECCETA